MKILLVGLTIAAFAIIAVIVGLNIYHDQHRLTKEKLAAAQKLWEAARVRDYDIDVTIGGRTHGRYQVQVRGGRIVAATMNGKPFDPPELANSWTMDEWLTTFLERDLENDAKPDSPPVYTQVEFDPGDGHLVHYLRSSVRQHLVMDVRLERVPPMQVSETEK
jgi:hypothetical protein